MEVDYKTEVEDVETWGTVRPAWVVAVKYGPDLGSVS